VNKKSKNLFFLGKGGTGKTTIAALTALALAEKGERIFLLSMDPAHNLFDIFQVSPTKKSVKIQENLIIEEIDIDYWIKNYLKSIEDKIARSYQHLTALSLEKHINTIRYSPGLEEYALQYAYEAVQKKNEGYAYKLFDMPPTALALRFFNLPKLTLIWLEQLIDLRKKILKKQKIINSVHQGETVQNEDKVLDQLYKMQVDNQMILSNFQDSQNSGMQIVLNEDSLSISESGDIYEMISGHKFSISGILINKFQNIMNKRDFTEKYTNLPAYFFPLAQNPLIGITELKEYLIKHVFQNYIDSIRKPTVV
jgi:arsenite-transporting ATPase